MSAAEAGGSKNLKASRQNQTSESCGSIAFVRFDGVEDTLLPRLEPFSHLNVRLLRQAVRNYLTLKTLGCDTLFW